MLGTVQGNAMHPSVHQQADDPATPLPRLVLNRDPAHHTPPGLVDDSRLSGTPWKVRFEFLSIADPWERAGEEAKETWQFCELRVGICCKIWISGRAPLHLVNPLDSNLARLDCTARGQQEAPPAKLKS